MTAGAFILMYHRIADSSSDPWQLCVSPEHFAEQLDVLRRHARVVPVAEIATDGDRRGSVRPRVALTFDDGYADNVSVAQPLLERQEIPATIFVTTGYVDADREFWWDELERVLLGASELPASLHLKIGDAPVDVELGDAPRASHEHRRWRAYEDEPPGPREAAYLRLWEQLVSSAGPGAMGSAGCARRADGRRTCAAPFPSDDHS